MDQVFSGSPKRQAIITLTAHAVPDRCGWKENLPPCDSNPFGTRALPMTAWFSRPTAEYNIRSRKVSHGVHGRLGTKITTD
ncbi:hypothetical protein KIN20_004465 [Parelaphostrongylus tenuis]|uniref:Uncharacterized protein n=1 Tax=Parelaphostrongylus tenuis TaxID=148309 RepID=A0AAD5M350_PARTN|nr:hypothetical protein KIN20_004465 [Parelaphostrongylus tenuis]